MIRETLNKEMLDVVKGWGVWIETIEITDVKILSSSLFKDMQSKFREEQKRTAQMNSLEIQNEVETERLRTEIEMNQKRVDAEITRSK
eukprot:CAMPEP_0116899126 /NCGR_PEP_ID=MMETSP0467-20121206/7750_1 /TAXON_ID=283647 /ORGANISM="Mesodinium pulex, Strain SPMC105" /LENGTH=87 /DNA_ID=CAMNT_0004571745 /DNA_START=576 /DNA_END=839 /DNA_ORIENTATION=+